MRAQASKDGLTLRVIAGSNNALLGIDLSEAARDKCLGFTIERTDLDTGAKRWLPNLLRFPGDKPDPSELEPISGAPAPKAGQTAAQEAPSVSSARAPLQKFRWADYTLDPGKRYAYRVIARKDTPAKIIQDGLDAEHRHAFDTIAGGVSVEVKTESNSPAAAAVFFNRGAAASKAYNDRYGDNDPQKIPDAMWWLSRGLEEALVGFIGHAVDASFAVHAAIYEFQKPTVLKALMQAKLRGCEVNVAYHGCAGTTTDKNKAATAKENINFEARPRSAAPSNAIMHNKFVVLLKKQSDGTLLPMALWTGSTNWTNGAIYGQLNVGHAVFDTNIAAAYEKYFQFLFANTGPDDMKKSTVALSPVPANRGAVNQGMTPIFSPQSKLDMIELYADICRSAKVLMVSAPFVLHQDIRKTFDDKPPDTLRFVLLDKPASLGKGPEVDLINNDPDNVVAVATTIKPALHDFQGNVLEDKESFHHPGIHIHTKIICTDPFGSDLILVAGLANFSENSTMTNDENSVIVRGDTAVMDIYVTEFMRMFDHYWFRAHIEGAIKSSNFKNTGGDFPMGLKEDASWSDPYYQPGNQKMLERLIFAGSEVS